MSKAKGSGDWGTIELQGNAKLVNYGKLMIGRKKKL